MPLTFRAVSEDTPGDKWATLFAEYRNAYIAWWAREGLSSRPTYHECHRALERHMPHLVPVYDRLAELAGGGDIEARFLSFYCPPRYLSGCSQAIWQGDEPLLVRNYDYSPSAFDAVVLKTRWLGRQVIGTTDGLFGIVDGMNDSGLAVSLTFGGRREVGTGFGVPLILRYVLETCDTTDEAAEVLKRVPCHMSYNVTLVDAHRRFVTAYLAPDRPLLASHSAVATNHQERVEWKSHARLTASVERERYLLQRLTLHPETQEKFISAFLRPPLYSLAFDQGFGTLYTASFRPKSGRIQYLWPDRVWEIDFEHFNEDSVSISYPGPTVEHNSI